MIVVTPGDTDLSLSLPAEIGKIFRTGSPATSSEAAILGKPPSEARPHLGLAEQWNADITAQVETPVTIDPEFRVINGAITWINNPAVPRIFGLHHFADDLKTALRPPHDIGRHWLTRRSVDSDDTATYRIVASLDLYDAMTAFGEPFADYWGIGGISRREQEGDGQYKPAGIQARSYA
jgi:hypothetical protein